MTETFVDIPNLILQNKNSKVIRESPDLISILPYKPISVSNNTIGFVFQTPSFNTLMSEKLLLSFRGIKLNFAFTGTPTGDINFAELGALALRSYPVERLVQTIQVIMGSSSISFALSDIMESVAFTSYDMDEYASSAASFDRPVEEVGCCMGAQIGQGVGAGAAGLLCAQTSSSTGSYILSGVPGSVPKGGSLNIESIGLQTANAALFSNGQFQANQAQTATNPVQVQVSMSGFLRAPLFQWLAKECKESFSCLSQLQFNLILNPAQCIVSYLEPRYTGIYAATIGTLQLQNIQFDSSTFVSSNITLSVRYITPPANYSMKDIVRQYYQIDRYITTYSNPINAATTIPAVVAGTTQISSNTYTLPCVPRYLMFFVKPARNYYYSNLTSLQVPNFYLPIVNLSITVANRTSQLNSCPVEHLYSLATEASLKSKFSVYRGYGSILPSNNLITPNAFGAAGDAVYSAGGAGGALSYEPYAGAPLVLDVSTALGLKWRGQKSNLIKNYLVSF